MQQEGSTEQQGVAEHHDHNLQRWQTHRMASVGWGIVLETVQVVHHIRLADQETGLETAEQSLVRLTEVLVEAFRHTGGSKRMGFLGIQGSVRSVGCSQLEFLQSQPGLAPYPYPTKSKLARDISISKGRNVHCT